MAKLIFSGEPATLVAVLDDGFVYRLFVVEADGELGVCPPKEIAVDNKELDNAVHAALPTGYRRWEDLAGFGYDSRQLLPVMSEQALSFFTEPVFVFRVKKDGSVSRVESEEEINSGSDQIYAIKLNDWLTYCGVLNDGKIVSRSNYRLRQCNYKDNDPEKPADSQTASDAALLEAYRSTGLSPDDIQEVADLFKSIPDADVPAEVKSWVQRGAWHARRCAELESKMQMMEMELTMLRVREAKTLKEQLIERLNQERDHILANIFDEIDGGGEAAVKRTALAAANQIALLNAIIHVFIGCDLQYIQCRDLTRIPEKISILERLYLTLMPEDHSSTKICFGESEIRDAIYEMVSKLGA